MPATAPVRTPLTTPGWIPWLLFLGALAMFLAGTGTLPLLDRDEPRFAEASREMRQRGDWIVPWLNDKPRYDKPPLVYWLQIAAYRGFGENSFSARLPSALAGAFTVVVIYAFGRRLRDAQTGLWAAIIFATCLQTLIHARLAVADMLMVLFFTTAVWSGWELRSPHDDQTGKAVCWLCFYLSLGLAFLAKGPVGLLPVLLPFLTPAFRGEPVPWRRFQLGWGLLLTLGLIGAWGIPALIQTKGEFWQVGMGKHVFERSIGVLDGHGASHFAAYLATVPLYFVTVFFSFFPWALWLPGLVRSLWRTRSGLSADHIYLLLGVAIVFLIFSLVRTKLPHYTLPAFPLLALLLAGSWTGTDSRRRQRHWAVTMTVFCFGLSLLVFPVVARLAPSAQLFAACSPWLQPDMALASTAYEEPSVAWYFRGRLRGFHEVLPAPALPEFMARPGSRLCLMPTDQLSELFPQIPAEWKTARTAGFNTANGKRVDLTVLIKPTAD